jgi:hypothetical protein
MSLRLRHHRPPRPCEHHAIYGTRCLECTATVRVSEWIHTSARASR